MQFCENRFKQLLKIYPKIPESYVDFCRKFGAVEINNKRILGVNCLMQNFGTEKQKINAYYLDVLDTVKDQSHFTKNQFLPIHAVGNGDYFGMCLKDNLNVEPSIKYYSHETDSFESTKFNNFIEFLNAVLDGGNLFK